MSLRRFACLAVLAVVACSSSTDGPTPNIASVMPVPLCDAQRDITVTITGSGFSPIVKDGLTSNPSVVMPRVVLLAGTTPTEIPAAGVSLGDASGTLLVVKLPTALLAPGSYDVQVINPDGHSDTLAGGLIVDPPPHITGVNPSSGAVGNTITVTLIGTGFRSGMTVTLDATPTVAATNLTVAPDGLSAQATFALAGVTPGVYGITVDNLDGCTDTLAASFTVYVEHTFTVTGIDPPFGCTCSTTSVTLSSPGGFVSTPVIEMRPTGQAGPVTRMTRVALVDVSTLTAVVPAALALGDYDVTVLNPPTDGGVARLDRGFRVVSMPVPQIEAIIPGRGAPAATNFPMEIVGANFRNPVKVELLDRTLTVVASVASVAPTSATRIDATFATLPLIEDAYLVRVTDLDENTYSTYSAFIVGSTGSNGKLHGFTEISALVTPRRLLAGASARDDLGNTYLYAIGGDTGGATPTALDSIEVSQLSKFGALGAWQQLRSPNHLATPRVAPVAVAVPLYGVGSPYVPIKTYIYVTGGQDAAGTVLGTIERAMVLRSEDAPIVTSAAVSTTPGSLADGTWYYKVSAVLASGDADNPGGETVASDEAILTIGSNTAIELAWSAVTVNGVTAAMYRVYRTPAANGSSQQEQLIATVSGTSYTDTGATAQAERPLPAGALGKWVAQTPTHAARWGHQAAVITDSTGAKFLHVLGGKSNLTTGYLSTIEVAPINSMGQLGTFVSTGTTAMATARAFFSLVVETSANVAGFTGVARLITTGGVDAGGSSSEVEFSDVTNGGANGGWTATGLSLNNRAGLMSVISSNKLFCMGGAGTANDTTFSSILMTGRNVGFIAGGAIGSPMQSTSSAFAFPRALGTAITGSGFIYFAAGSSDGTDAVNTVYQTF